MARGRTHEEVGAKPLDAGALERVRFRKEDVGQYNEPAIFAVWAEKNGITHSMEGAAQLRAGFDEHVVTWVTAADAKCKHVRVRLLAHQLQTGGQPPRVGAPPTVAAAAQAAAAALEPGHTGGGGLATIEEMVMITGRRIEVNMLSHHEDEEDALGTWFAGTAKSATRTRGLLVDFDDGSHKYFLDIDARTEGTTWRCITTA